MLLAVRIGSLAAFLASLAPAQHSAVSLNGIDSYGTAAGVGDLVTNSTWEAWVRFPAQPVSNGNVILQRWGMYSHALSVDTINGAACIDMYSCWSDLCPQTCSPAGTLQPDTWHHVALVYGPEAAPSCNCYVDGNLVAWCGAQQCDPWEGWETVLGAWGNTGYSGFLHAQVDEARISDVPRYSGPFTPSLVFAPDAHTVGLWHFDEGSGSIAYDSSGNGRDFTLHGGFTWTSGPATSYCTSSTTTHGCNPVIAGVGTPLTQSTGFNITVSAVEGQRTGLLFYGLSPASTHWYLNSTSYLCIVPPLQRMVQLSSGGTDGTCDGVLSVDWNSWRASHSNALGAPFAAGQVFYAQGWFRDPGAPSTTNLSNGLSFTLCN